MIRTKREMDEQKAAMELTVETRVQQSLTAAGEKAKIESEKKTRGRGGGEREGREGRRGAGRGRRWWMRWKLKEQSLVELQSKFDGQAAKLAESAAVHAEALRKQRETGRGEAGDGGHDPAADRRESCGRGRRRQSAKLKMQSISSWRKKDLTIKAMQDRIEELKRTSEQGSQQVQGEVLELLLEQQLGAKFPHDLLEPVAKGEHGGDLLHPRPICRPAAGAVRSFGRPSGPSTGATAG